MEKNVSPGKQHGEGMERAILLDQSHGAWLELGISCGWCIS